MKLSSCFNMAIAFVIVLLVISCKEENKLQTPPEYAITIIKEDSVVVKNSFPATISGYSDAEIRSNVSGFIIKIHVSEGDMVNKGDLLFEIDHDVYKAEYNTALASLHIAEANVETAKLTADNKTNLAKKGIISEYGRKHICSSGG